MADATHIPDEAETRARWGGFAWTEANAAKAKEVFARYPKGREHSAIMPLLDLAQRQVGAEPDTKGLITDIEARSCYAHAEAPRIAYA